MLLLNGYKEREFYRIIEVLSPKNKFYGNSGIPIVAFITPMSLVYSGRKNHLVVKFKKQILDYADGFIDEPLEQGDMPQALYELKLETYEKEKPLRLLSYCIEQYKRSTDEEFYSRPISYRLLTELLSSGEYIDEEFSFSPGDDNPLFDGDSYWFPCQIDTIFTGFSSRAFRNNAVIAQFNKPHIYGVLGYNSVLYSMEHQSNGEDIFKETDVQKCAYYIDTEHNTARKVDTPEWLNGVSFFSFTSVLFVKDYIVLPDNTCINYYGEVLVDKTIHYRHVDELNEIIKLFVDYKALERIPQHIPYLEIAVPNDFSILNIDVIENLILPMLESKDCLNDIAAMNYIRLHTLFEKIGLTTEFTTALVNISEVNKKVSKTDLCGDELFSILCLLAKTLDNNDEFIALLNDINRLQEVV